MMPVPAERLQAAGPAASFFRTSRADGFSPTETGRKLLNRQKGHGGGFHHRDTEDAKLRGARQIGVPSLDCEDFSENSFASLINRARARPDFARPTSALGVLHTSPGRAKA